MHAHGLPHVWNDEFSVSELVPLTSTNIETLEDVAKHQYVSGLPLVLLASV